jgi:hypothetical protein
MYKLSLISVRYGTVKILSVECSGGTVWRSGGGKEIDCSYGDQWVHSDISASINRLFGYLCLRRSISASITRRYGVAPIHMASISAAKPSDTPNHSCVPTYPGTVTEALADLGADTLLQVRAHPHRQIKYTPAISGG